MTFSIFVYSCKLQFFNYILLENVCLYSYICTYVDKLIISRSHLFINFRINTVVIISHNTHLVVHLVKVIFLYLYVYLITLNTNHMFFAV